MNEKQMSSRRGKGEAVSSARKSQSRAAESSSIFIHHSRALRSLQTFDLGKCRLFCDGPLPVWIRRRDLDFELERINEM